MAFRVKNSYPTDTDLNLKVTTVDNKNEDNVDMITMKVVVVSFILETRGAFNREMCNASGGRL